MKLGYIVLAHEALDTIIPLLESFLSQGDAVALHYDRRGSDYKKLKILKEKFPDLLTVPSIKVRWGEASIVKATLLGIRALMNLEEKPDYVTLLSGSCFPIKPRSEFLTYLDQNRNFEFIECHDITKSPWVTMGLEKDRWEIYHFVNWRRKPVLFTFLHKIQRHLLPIRRRFPFGSNMYMGSQWWTLSLKTLERILEIVDSTKVLLFIKRTWIPDEFFFQTLVGNLVSPDNIRPTLMHFQFNSQGIPKVYTHWDRKELADSGKFFARKIKKGDQNLISQLIQCYRKGIALPKADTLLENKGYYPGFASGRDPHFRLLIKDFIPPVIISVVRGKNFRTYKDFFQGVRKEIPGFRVYGRLMGEHKIDYGPDEGLPGYDSSAVHLRDLSLDEFFSSIGLHSPKGFSMAIDSRNLINHLEFFDEIPNLMILDFISHMDNELDLYFSLKVQNIFKGNNGNYIQILGTDVPKLLRKHVPLITNNLYYHFHLFKKGLSHE